MSRRASHQEQTGGAGVSEVTAEFELLGWGVAENSRHDLGTDLFLSARDERLFDLGLVVGAQVKTGDSYFAEPNLTDDGLVDGWWFRDDDRSHLDSWVAHGLPHLIILHDLSTRASYWEHVTAERIVSTGRGAKIRVPKSNIVDSEHREALLAVATSAGPTLPWEGTAWTGSSHLAPRDMWRHALIVPRLVAPHPNAGYANALGPEQAIALLVQARLRDLDRFAETQIGVPTIAEALGSKDWSWRFVGALGRYLTTGDIDALLQVADQPLDQIAGAAARSAVTAGLLADGRADEAVEILEACISSDEAEPIDHCWLTVQLARAYVEIGRIQEARQLAFDAQSIRVTHPDDVTATGLAGVAAVLLFDTAEWGKREVADVITSMDTMTAWWRTETTSRGLEALAERTFKHWARDTAITLGGSDEAHNQLFAASVTANNVGDHGSWRHLSGLLGQDTLIRLDHRSDRDAARNGLSALRLAGDEGTLKLATRRLFVNGPASAVQLAAADVRLERSTRTTGASDLALLEQAGDLLDEVAADRSIAWILATLEDPSTFVERTSPSYLLIPRLVDTLAAVLPAASADGKRSILAAVASLAGQGDQMLAISWTRVVRAIPTEMWDEHTALSIMQGIDSHQDELQMALLGVAGQFDASAQTRLIERASNGSLSALGALGDVREMNSETADNLIGKLTDRIRQTVSSAHAHSYAMGGGDLGQALAILNSWHADVADWESLLILLEDPKVAARDKRGALAALASLVENLPADVRQRLEELSLKPPNSQEAIRGVMFGDDGDLSGAFADLAAALEVLDDEATAARLLDLLAGESEQRQWAARVARRLGRAEDTGVLVTLAQDADPEVRSYAAMGLAALVAGGKGGAVAFAGLERCLDDPGVLVPLRAGSVLANMPIRTQSVKELLIGMSTHQSARVREIAQKAVAHAPEE